MAFVRPRRHRPGHRWSVRSLYLSAIPPLRLARGLSGRSKLLREIICSYEEQVIKVYNVAQETDLDLWCLELPMMEAEHTRRGLP